jgi:hypothetical protein
MKKIGKLYNRNCDLKKKVKKNTKFKKNKINIGRKNLQGKQILNILIVCIL